MIERPEVPQLELPPGLERPGQQVIKRNVYVYRCFMCGRVERLDDRYGPACTGPGATDDHPMEPMAFVGEDKPRLIVP